MLIPRGPGRQARRITALANDQMVRYLVDEQISDSADEVRDSFCQVDTRAWTTLAGFLTTLPYPTLTYPTLRTYLAIELASKSLMLLTRISFSRQSQGI